MKTRKKLWLSGSVLAGAVALVAALAIPLVASAGAKAGAKCHIKNDAVVDISQFEQDSLNASAQNAKCSGSLVNGSYKPGAIIAPVTGKVKLKPNSDGTPGYSGQLRTKTFTGTITLNPGGSVCNPCGPTLKVKVRVGVDFKPATVYVEIEKL